MRQVLTGTPGSFLQPDRIGRPLCGLWALTAGVGSADGAPRGIIISGLTGRDRNVGRAQAHAPRPQSPFYPAIRHESSLFARSAPSEQIEPPER